MIDLDGGARLCFHQHAVQTVRDVPAGWRRVRHGHRFRLQRLGPVRIVTMTCPECPQTMSVCVQHATWWNLAMSPFLVTPTKERTA